jgi:hypothetical protein
MDFPHRDGETDYHPSGQLISFTLSIKFLAWSVNQFVDRICKLTFLRAGDFGEWACRLFASSHSPSDARAKRPRGQTSFDR